MKVAVAAFLRGREYGRREAGLEPTEPPLDVTSLEALVLADEWETAVFATTLDTTDLVLRLDARSGHAL